MTFEIQLTTLWWPIKLHPDWQHHVSAEALRNFCNFYQSHDRLYTCSGLISTSKNTHLFTQQNHEFIIISTNDNIWQAIDIQNHPDIDKLSDIFYYIDNNRHNRPGFFDYNYNFNNQAESLIQQYDNNKI